MKQLENGGTLFVEFVYVENKRDIVIIIDAAVKEQERNDRCWPVFQLIISTFPF